MAGGSHVAQSQLVPKILDRWGDAVRSESEQQAQSLDKVAGIAVGLIGASLIW